jgi:phosphoenolpyruvate carboxylase
VTPTAALCELAARSGDTSPFREDEPYRRAVRGMHDRLAATASLFVGDLPGHTADVSLAPYLRPAELADDLAVIDASLRSHKGGALADARVADVRRAVDVFGFHLCGLDLQHALVVDNPSLERSIRYRFPYLDPLNLLQVALLARWRAGDRDDFVQRGIQLTINGLATGLRNSG